MSRQEVCLSVCLLSVYISARQSTKVTVRSFTLLKDCFMCLSVYLALGLLYVSVGLTCYKNVVCVCLFILL